MNRKQPLTNQDLFASAATSTERIHFAPGWPSWSGVALQALKDERTPDSVYWVEDRPREESAVAVPNHDSETASGTGNQGRASTAEGEEKDLAGNDGVDVLPASLLSDARLAYWHRADDRWSLLYSLCWRFHHGETCLGDLLSDPEVIRLHQYAKAVSRAAHKMKAFLRFREIEEPCGDGDAPRFVAWFEPEHPVLDLTAPFFKRRFTRMRWSILTPERSAHWEGEGEVWFSAGAERADAPIGDRFEEAWGVYYASIFNPARLKFRAMQSEMPQKYWKNLPEARLIPGLIATAHQRRLGMQSQVVKDQDVLQCGPLPASPAQLLARDLELKPEGTLQALAADATSCRRCDLYQTATQVVFGTGSEKASLMLLGAMPEDAEDLSGRAFSGEAGKVLHRALAQAGIDVNDVYMTYAIKHFAYHVDQGNRGRQRHVRATSRKEQGACLHWLTQEMKQVSPDLVVCLGREAWLAVLSLAGANAADCPVQLGELIRFPDFAALATYSPSRLLAQTKSADSDPAFQRLTRDLRRAWLHVSREGAAHD